MMKKQTIILLLISLFCLQGFGQTNTPEDSVTINQISVPNAFTPNDDGVHDVLLLEGSEHIQSLTFKVYNRWGEVVFETEEKDIAWTGESKDRVCAVGVYYWILEAVMLNGEDVQKKGNVTLMR
jgi:gliding motility-associated-like protein